MRCEQFEHRLNEVLDQRRDPAQDRALHRHAQTCSACRGLLDTHRQILSAFRLRKAGTVRPLPPQSSLNDRRIGNRSAALAALLATACAVPLLIGSWMSATRSGQTKPDPLIVPQGYSVAASDQGLPSSRPPIAQPAPPDSSPEALAISWSGLRELNLEWLLHDLDMPQQTRADWLSRVREVGGSLRPLTNSVTSTFSILKRTWPGTQPTKSTGADQAFLPLESDLLA
jgi:hypothetical protein